MVLTGLTILAFKLTNLAKPIWVLFFKCCWTQMVEFLKSPAKSRNIIKAIFQCYFRNIYRFMEQVQSRFFNSPSSDVLIDSFICNYSENSMKVKGGETTNFR